MTPINSPILTEQIRCSGAAIASKTSAFGYEVLTPTSSGAADWPAGPVKSQDREGGLDQTLRQLVAGSRAPIKLIVTIRAAWSRARQPG